MENEEVSTEKKEYTFPPLSLLKCQLEGKKVYENSYLIESARKIQNALEYSGVGVTVVNVCVGPISVRYDLALDAGVRLAEVKCYASDDEIERVVNHVKAYCEQQSFQHIVERLNVYPNLSKSIDSKYDTYLVDAMKCVLKKEKASIGMLQRVFKIGFNRAARLMDQMEENSFLMYMCLKKMERHQRLTF